MLSLFAKNVGVPKFLSLGTPTFIIEPDFLRFFNFNETITEDMV
jgi:hypothetical protein